MPITLPDVELVAFNTATASENKIHDNTVAAALGFGSGLVPGVDVHAYLCQPALAHWGRDLLTNGQLTVRFDAPVYDGEPTTVRATVDDEGVLAASIASRDTTAATLTGRLVDRHPTPPTTTATPLPDERPPASPETLAPGTSLGSITDRCDREAGRRYLSDIRDIASPVDDWGVVHPAWLLRRANELISHNVLLGPWIHVGSTINHHRPLALGETLVVQGQVSRAYEHKGHRFVVVEGVMTGEDDGVVAAVRHTAIYEPRQVRESA
ncbi:MAG: hotdog fold domain-containing protein [Actinomycetota bacterium]